MVQRYSEQDYRYTGNGRDRSGDSPDRYQRDKYARDVRTVSAQNSRQRSASRGNTGRQQRTSSQRSYQDSAARGSQRSYQNNSGQRAASRPSRSGAYNSGSNYSGQGGYGQYRKGARDTRAAVDRVQQNQGKFSRGNYTGTSRKSRKSRNIMLAAIMLGLIAAIIIGIFVFINTRPVTIIVNGKTAEVAYNTTYADLHEKYELLTSPYGDLVAVDGTVLEEGGGEIYTIYDNNEPVEDINDRVNKNSVVTDARGADVTEEYDVVETTTPYGLEVQGGEEYNFYTASCTWRVYDGTEGIQRQDVGRISGITVDDPNTIPVQNRTYWSVSPQITSQQVIALTFDDGPSDEYTLQILALLQQYGAKATFFENGTNIEAYPDLPRQLADAGMQVASHGYQHGGDDYPYMWDMSPEQLVADLSANQQAILNTTGTTCTIVRPPGGNFDYENIVAGQDYITCAVGWDIDTRDWSRPGAQAIVDTTLAEAYSGAIVLMHDGGGDRSQTVEALSIILPELQAQGYQFVTIDELLELQRQEYIANGTIAA